LSVVRRDAHHVGLPIRVAAHLRRDVPLALLDVTSVFVAYLLTLVLRFDGSVPARYWSAFRWFIPIVMVVHLTANYLMGLYGQMWRYASVQEARRVIMAVGTALVLNLTITLWVVPGRHPIPLSVLGLGAMISLIAFGALRFQSRLFALRRRSADHEGAVGKTRVLLIGAGDACAMVLGDMQKNPSLGLVPVGILDDDPRKLGLVLHGIPILGGRTRIPELAEKLRADEVLLTIPSATSEVVREIAALCEEADVHLRVLPSVREIVGGKVGARDFRDLQIEDLLGRKQVTTDLAAVHEMLRGRRVLITGAGGSIGSEIARQVAACEPSSLILLDNDETHLHDVMTDLAICPEARSMLADIRDRLRIVQLFQDLATEVVFHAAALKHVPVLESYPREAVLTNVIGTANVVDAAVVAGVERFVLISTDKAVRPSSVMGGSKRFAEEIVRSVGGEDRRFCSVRFGNVLGSRGSVIPTFLRQIHGGGPVTVTDPSMMRYFMSVQEAVQLVLQAGALSAGGEVFTLEMGEQVNILDLARKLIRLSGRVPDRDVKIEIVGVRPGEKLTEDLHDHDEEPGPTSHPGVVVSQPPAPDRATLKRRLRELELLASEGSVEALATAMKAPPELDTQSSDLVVAESLIGESA
jgi:FlaA1/EpsC-like NDP-sugar epimerase